MITCEHGLWSYPVRNRARPECRRERAVEGGSEQLRLLLLRPSDLALEIVNSIFWILSEHDNF